VHIYSHTPNPRSSTAKSPSYAQSQQHGHPTPANGNAHVPWQTIRPGTKKAVTIDHHQLQLDWHLHATRHRPAPINSKIYVLQSALIPRITYTSRFFPPPPRLSSWRSWTKRSSNGDNKSSDSPLPSPLQFSQAPPPPAPHAK
jgi:hypothetical protein